MSTYRIIEKQYNYLNDRKTLELAIAYHKLFKITVYFANIIIRY